MADDTPMEIAIDKDKEWISLEDVEGFDEPLQFRLPKGGATIYMMSRMSSSRVENPQEMASFINHLTDLMHPETRSAVEGRLFDPDDEFDIEGFMDLWQGLLEAWSARPTQSSSDSSPSPKTGGKKSTGRASARASTSRRSPSTDS